MLEHLDWADDMTAFSVLPAGSWLRFRNGLKTVEQNARGGGHWCDCFVETSKKTDHLLHQLSLTLPLADFLSAIKKRDIRGYDSM